MNKKISLLMLILAACIFGCTGMAGCSDDPAYLPSRYEIPSGVVPDIPSEEVVIVSNKQDFNSIFGENEDRLKPVTFDNKALMVATGISNTGISDVTYSYSEDTGIFKIVIHKGLTTSAERWSAGYLVRKGTKASDVQLSIEYVKAL